MAFAAAVEACELVGDYKAISLLHYMEKRGFSPTAKYYNTAVQACVLTEHWASAITLFIFMKDFDLVIFEKTYNDVIRACEKTQRYQEGFRIFNEMLEKGYTPNDESFVCAAFANWQNCNWHGAFELLSQRLELYAPRN